MKVNDLLRDIINCTNQPLKDTALFLNMEAEQLIGYMENEPIPLRTFSSILKKFALKIGEKEQNQYVIVPKSEDDSCYEHVFYNVNSVLKNIRKHAHLNQKDFGVLFNENALTISRYENDRINVKTDFFELVLQKMNATITFNATLLTEHFTTLKQQEHQNNLSTFFDKLTHFNIRQTGGYCYLLDGLMYAEKLKKSILVSISEDTVCVFRTPNKGILNCTSLPSKEAFLREYHIEEGSGALAKFEVVIAFKNKNGVFEKTNHFDTFFTQNAFDFLNYASSNMEKLVYHFQHANINTAEKC